MKRLDHRFRHGPKDHTDYPCRGSELEAASSKPEPSDLPFCGWWAVCALQVSNAKGVKDNLNVDIDV